MRANLFTFDQDKRFLGRELRVYDTEPQEKAQLVEAWSAGYVAGQECSKDGVPRRNPFSIADEARDLIAKVTR